MTDRSHHMAPGTTLHFSKTDIRSQLSATRHTSRNGSANEQTPAGATAFGSQWLRTRHADYIVPYSAASALLLLGPKFPTLAYCTLNL